MLARLLKGKLQPFVSGEIDMPAFQAKFTEAAQELASLPFGVPMLHLIGWAAIFTILRNPGRGGGISCIWTAHCQLCINADSFGRNGHRHVWNGCNISLELVLVCSPPAATSFQW